MASAPTLPRIAKVPSVSLRVARNESRASPEQALADSPSIQLELLGASQHLLNANGRAGELMRDLGGINSDLKPLQQR
jgi:hypothetical protein